jgi:cell division protein FtsW
MLKNNSLFILILSLLGFGLLIIADSTLVTSSKLYGSPYRFSILQLVWILMGLAGYSLFSYLDYKNLEKFSVFLFIFTTISLVALAALGFLPCGSSIGFAPCINGANRWLYLNPDPLPKIPFMGVLGFQPGELAKLSLILFLAFKIGKDTKGGKNPFKTYLIASGIVALLVLMQPNMSTSAMLFVLGTAVYFASGASLRELFFLIPSLILLGAVSIFASPYRRVRFLTLLSGREDADLSSGYHIKQILLALGSGGFWGLGFGQSKQKFNYLPEVASDSIFAIIGEEFGFIGTTLIMAAFAFLIYKGFSIARKTKDPVGKLLAIGISTWIGLQFFINVAAMTKIIPLTGVPMPLISYGGSSMLFSMVGLGILSNIDKQTRK